MFFEGVCVHCLCGLNLLFLLCSKLYYIDFSNFQDSFLSFGDNLWVILVTVLWLVGSLLKPLPSPAFAFLTKVSVSRLLLVLEVCNVQLTFSKPYAANVLAVSDLTLDRSFRVKLWRVRIKGSAAGSAAVWWEISLLPIYSLQFVI